MCLYLSNIGDVCVSVSMLIYVSLSLLMFLYFSNVCVSNICVFLMSNIHEGILFFFLQASVVTELHTCKNVHNECIAARGNVDTELVGYW